MESGQLKTRLNFNFYVNDLANYQNEIVYSLSSFVSLSFLVLRLTQLWHFMTMENKDLEGMRIVLGHWMEADERMYTMSPASASNFANFGAEPQSSLTHRSHPTESNFVQNSSPG